MSTVKAVNIQHPNSSNINMVLDQYGAVSGGLPSPNRNLVYNGAMQIHQRSTSASGIISGDTYATADRWKTGAASLGTWTQTIENDAPTGSGFRKSLKMLCTTANTSPAASSEIGIVQAFEGQDLQRIAKGTASAQQLTISFWVKSNVIGTYIVELMDDDNANRHVSKSYTINSSSTWEYKTLVFPADATGGQFDNDNAQSMRLHFWMASGSNFTSGSLQTSWGSLNQGGRASGQVNSAALVNNYWQITGVQLEIGPIATPFEFKPYAQELRECQRYYYRFTNDTGAAIFPFILQAYSAGAVFGKVLDLPVTMRSTPVCSASGSIYPHNSTGSPMTAISTYTWTPTRQSINTGSWSGSSGLTAGYASGLGMANGAYIDASAEL